MVFSEIYRPLPGWVVRIPPVLFVSLVTLAFMTTHLDASPAQSQLSYLVWILPFAWLIRADRVIYQPEKIVMLLASGLFLSSAISFYASGDIWLSEAFRTYWLYLLPVGLLGTLSLFAISRQWISSILIASAILSLVVVIKDLTLGGARGVHHGLPIPYGIISLTTALLCALFAMDQKIHRLLRVLLFAASIVGFIAALWSQTRGAWLFWILWLVVVCIIWLFHDRSLVRKISVISAVLLVFGVLGYSNSDRINGRVGSAYTSTVKYFSVGSASTSVGQRLELWKVAANEFFENPVLGGGKSGFLAKKLEMNSSGEVMVYSSLEHAHNDFLWVLSTRGLLSFVIYMALYGYLIRFYWQNITDSHTRIASYAGLTVCAGGLVYGMSEIFLSLKITIGYFFIIQMVLIRYICQEKAAIVRV